MLSALLLSGLLGIALSADILAVFPHTGKSHFDVFEPLVLALAARGHRLTVISFYPQKGPVGNYTDVSLVGLVPLRLNQVRFDQLENPISDFISMSRMGLEMCEKILTFHPVNQLLQSDAKFDLIIVEFFNTECFLSLVHKYKAPYVALSSANTSPEQDGRLGLHPHPAYVSHPDLPLDSRMSLLQKLMNVLYTVCTRLVRVYFSAQEQKMVRRLVEDDVPPLVTIAHNVSAFLVNTHYSMLRARPLVPGYVEIGGVHIHPLKPLDKVSVSLVKDVLEKVISASARSRTCFSLAAVSHSPSGAMFSALLLSSLLGAALSADILAVFPHTGKSHFDVFEPLVLALAARGHRLTVISFYPQKTPVANYTDISLVGLTPLRLNIVKIGEEDTSQPDTFSVSNIGLPMCEMILVHPPVQRLLTSDARFDLVILEMFDSDCFLSIVHRFKVPHIGFNSAKTSPAQDSVVGNPSHPGYVSHINLPFNNHMTFLQRVYNVAYYIKLEFVRFFLVLWEQREFRRMVGEDIPSLDDLAHQASLILVNTHHTLLRPRPLVPGYVEVGGIHIKPPKPLVKELDQFLNDSPEGAILFSMGSVLQSSSFPPGKRQAIMEAFAELPVRVIMKWENDSLPGKPDNVRLSKWLPQRDILAHPKIVAFMGHGGLLSTSEAVYCGVPMVLIPMFGDQSNNVAHLEASGAAVKLRFDDISKETVLRSLRAVLYDSRYREKARTLSEQFRDRPMSPLDTAVYWTEYVLRHKGARHLRSPAVDMPWYQLWLLDVAVALLFALVTLLVVVYWLAKRITLVVSHALYPAKQKKA